MACSLLTPILIAQTKKNPNQRDHNNKMVTPGDTSRLIDLRYFLDEKMYRVFYKIKHIQKL